MRVLWLLSLLIALTSAASKCPAQCSCQVESSVVCSTLDIEPFPADMTVTTLTLSNIAEPFELTGEVLTKLRLTELRRLFITNATITRWDASAFTTAPIDQLLVRHARIPTVDHALFRTSKHIRQVDLSYSTIERFVGIESPLVEEIVLAGCGFTQVPGNAFAYLPALTILDLQDNAIERVNLTEIAGEEIVLSGNRLTSLYIPAAVNNGVALNVNKNPLRRIEAEAGADWEKLSARGCELSAVDFLKNLTELKQVDLSGNRIVEIPEDTFTLSSNVLLEKLDLSSNLLTTLPQSMRRLIDLQHLRLDANNFGVLPVLPLGNSLEFFFCTDCHLSELNAQTFNTTRTLKSIDLSNNGLKELPEAVFAPIMSLVIVNLSNNSLTAIPRDVFVHNSELKTVILKQNPLAAIEASTFRNNHQLYKLDVSICALTQLWADRSRPSLPSLRELFADNNTIAALSEDDMKVAPKLIMFSMLNNPFACLKAKVAVIDKLQELGMCTDVDYEYDNDNDNEYAANDDEDDDNADDEDDDDDDDDDVNIDDQAQDNGIIDDNYSVYETKFKLDDEKAQMAQDIDDVAAIELSNFAARQRSSKQMLLFLLPTLVFVLTALVVLLLTVSVILCVLQKRNGRRTNAPQINIIPWSTSNKMKKHSGSIYRPLSEEYIPA